LLTIHTLYSFRVDPYTSERINKSRSAQLSHANTGAPTNSSNNHYEDKNRKEETTPYTFESDEDSVDLSPPPPHDCSGGSGSSICDGDNNESLNVSSASDGDGAGSANNEMQLASSALVDAHSQSKYDGQQAVGPSSSQPLKTCGKCGGEKQKCSYINDEWLKLEDQKRRCKECRKERKRRIKNLEKLEGKRRKLKEKLDIEIKVLDEEIGLLRGDLREEDDHGQDNKRVETHQAREQGRMQRQVNDIDLVVLLDCKTSQVIINCTQLVGNQLKNNTIENEELTSLLQDKKDGSLQLIDVRKPDSRFDHNGRGLSLDVMPQGQSEENRFADAIVQHASAIAVALATGKKALVYCENGRSRSPAVVAAFYILFRGVSLGGVKIWFREAYPIQRPLTANVSASFPNLGKFECVLNLPTLCLKEPTTTVRGFNLAGKFDSLVYYLSKPSLILRLL